MPRFSHDGLTFDFLDAGEGPPILLIHGFGSNKETNWVDPGWVATLTRAGRRAVALDNRGHGASDKPREAARYATPLMAEDARALLDHLNIPRADVMGYSMGARIAAFLALAHPERVRRLVLGGLGMGLIEGVGEAGPIIEALLAPSIDEVASPRGRMFRAFADQTKSDRVALAACMSAMRVNLKPEAVRRIAVPTLVAVGTKDAIAGDPHRLAALLPRGRALDIPERDHMPAVGDKAFKTGVLAFLEEGEA